MLPSLPAASALQAHAARLPPSLALFRPTAPPHHCEAAIKNEPLAAAERGLSGEFHGASSNCEGTAAHALEQRRAKSNSERGKEFRAKRKKYEGELEKAVYKLRAHVAELDMRRGVWEKQLLDARHTEMGSLARVVHEYFTLFRFGLQDPDLLPTAVAGSKHALVASSAGESALEKIRKQEEFILCVMDSDALVGDQSGPAASLAQWRMYTISHGSLRNEPFAITTSGTPEQPCIEVHSDVSGRITRDTIRYMFPGAVNDEVLVQRFLERRVVYKSVFRFHFTDGNKIAIESADINFVGGLQDAGFSLGDISQLMQRTVLTPHCTIPEVRSPSPPTTPPVGRTSPTTTKLSLGFLLGGEEEEELRPDERVQELAP